MKKIAIVFLSIACLLCAVLGGGCKKKNNDDKVVLPTIPSGVKLEVVDDVAATAASFAERFAEAENVALEYYDYYTRETGGSGYGRELLIKGKYYLDGEVSYGDATGEVNKTEQTGASGRETESDPVTVKLRSGAYNVVSDGYVKTTDGKTTLKSSGLKGVYRDPTANLATLMKSISFYAGVDGILSEVKDGGEQYAEFSAEVRADATKLYVNMEYTGETGGSDVYRHAVVYMDLAAGLSKNSFDAGAISAKSAEHVRYYTLDYDKFVADFMNDKAIELVPQGGGLTANIVLNSTSLIVNFIYDGKYSNTNLNIGFADGSIFFPENAFSVLSAKIDKDGFSLDKLGLLYFELTAEYTYRVTEGGVPAEYNCTTRFIIDLYGDSV